MFGAAALLACFWLSCTLWLTSGNVCYVCNGHRPKDYPCGRTRHEDGHLVAFHNSECDPYSRCVRATKSDERGLDLWYFLGCNGKNESCEDSAKRYEMDLSQAGKLSCKFCSDHPACNAKCDGSVCDAYAPMIESDGYFTPWTEPTSESTTTPDGTSIFEPITSTVGAFTTARSSSDRPVTPLSTTARASSTSAMPATTARTSPPPTFSRTTSPTPYASSVSSSQRTTTSPRYDLTSTRKIGHPTERPVLPYIAFSPFPEDSSTSTKAFGHSTERPPLPYPASSPFPENSSTFTRKIGDLTERPPSIFVKDVFPYSWLFDPIGHAHLVGAENCAAVLEVGFTTLSAIGVILATSAHLTKFPLDCRG